MKTIYTDRFGIYPWAMLFLSFVTFWSAYDVFFEGSRAPFGLDRTAGGLIFVLGGSLWLFLAAKRFRDVLRAKREGRDPTILHVSDG